MIPLYFSSTNSYFEEQYCKSNLKLPVWSVWSEKEVDNMSGLNLEVFGSGEVCTTKYKMSKWIFSTFGRESSSCL